MVYRFSQASKIAKPMLATDRKKRTIEGTIMKISKGILFASAVLISHNTFAEEILYKQVDAIEAVEIEVIEIEEEDEAEPYWEFLAMGAFAAINTDDFFISETENWKDKFSPDDGSWESWSAQLGVGYMIPLFDAEEYSDELQWFPGIEPQVNVYYLDGNTSGDVYLFESADFNNAGYGLDIESTRLMFDTALTVASWRNISVYGIAGLGIAWNNVGFNITPNEDCPYTFYPESKSQTNFAYEFGGGVTLDITENIAFSAEYLYTGFSDVDIEMNEFESNNIDLSSQAVFLGFRVSI